MSEFLSTEVELSKILIFGGPAIILLSVVIILLCRKAKEVEELGSDAKKLIDSFKNIDQWYVNYPYKDEKYQSLDYQWCWNYVYNTDVNIKILYDGKVMSVTDECMVQFNKTDIKHICKTLTNLVYYKNLTRRTRSLNKLES